MGYAIEPVSPRPWQDVQVPVRPVGKDIQNMRQVVLVVFPAICISSRIPVVYSGMCFLIFLLLFFLQKPRVINSGVPARNTFIHFDCPDKLALFDRLAGRSSLAETLGVPMASGETMENLQRETIELVNFGINSMASMAHVLIVFPIIYEFERIPSLNTSVHPHFVSMCY